MNVVHVTLCATAVIAAALFLGSSNRAVAKTQDPSPPLDPSPFERPRPICTLSGTDPDEVLHRLGEATRAEKFDLEEFDTTSGSFIGRRLDTTPTGASAPITDDRSDRVLVWIERDLVRPTEKFKVFLLYARYQKIWGAALEVKRVLARPSDEAKRIGPLKKRIVDLATQ